MSSREVSGRGLDSRLRGRGFYITERLLNGCKESNKYVLSAENFCKQFGPRSWSKLFDTLMVFLKEFFQKVCLKIFSRRQKKACKITQQEKKNVK